MRLLISLEVTLGTHLASANSFPSQSWFRGWKGVSSAQGKVPVVRCNTRAEDGGGRLWLSCLLAVLGGWSCTAVLGAECSRLGAMVLSLWQPWGQGLAQLARAWVQCVSGWQQSPLWVFRSEVYHQAGRT